MLCKWIYNYWNCYGNDVYFYLLSVAPVIPPMWHFRRKYVFEFSIEFESTYHGASTAAFLCSNFNNFSLQGNGKNTFYACSKKPGQYLLCALHIDGDIRKMSKWHFTGKWVSVETSIHACRQTANIDGRARWFTNPPSPKETSQKCNKSKSHNALEIFQMALLENLLEGPCLNYVKVSRGTGVKYLYMILLRGEREGILKFKRKTLLR